MAGRENIRAISLAFHDARGLDDALRLVAEQVREVTAADFAVVFLKPDAEARIVRRALARREGVAEGTPLTLEAAAFAEGVARRREPAIVADLGAGVAGEPGRPRLRPRGALAAAPVIHAGQVSGVVLVASAVPGHFEPEVLELLLTVSAQLAGRVSRAMIREDLGAALEAGTAGGRSYKGAAGAAGLAIGRVVVVGRVDLADVPDRGAEDVDAEVARVRNAVARFHSELERFSRGASLRGTTSEAQAIFDVYRQLVGDATLVEEIVAGVRAGNWARGALRAVIEEKAGVFERLEDSYLRARAEDFREIGRRILHHLDGRGESSRQYPEEAIIAADEIGIVELAEVPRERLAGLVSKQGSVLSHTAVLARALNVPAVMGLADLTLADLDGQEVVVDGHQGLLVVAPRVEMVESYRAAAREEARVLERLGRDSAEPAITLDGVRIGMFSPAGIIADLEPVQVVAVEGIGLYRTEFTFMMRDAFPTEREQTVIYRKVLEAMAPRPVTMRTLDAGGDKPLPYFAVDERNPFLGWRGIRMSLDHPELFLTQVRAMLAANVGPGNLRMMFPMVASVDELEAALAMVEQAADELDEEGITLDGFELGMMVEVPSAVYQIEALARRVDFVSIGTNDLVQYLLAVDRDNARVANRYDTLHPAVLRALNDVAAGAHHAGTSVGVCGEMAGEPEAVLALVGMGVDDLSASPARLPLVKAVVRATTRARAGEVLAEALTLESGAEIRRLFRDELRRLGLGELIARSSETPSVVTLRT